MALTGQRAPEFELGAYDPKTDSFTKVKLSDYVPNKEGKFLVVCFYPADFTFV